MATADNALILSHLHLGKSALHPEVRDALDAAASGPPAQIILAGHTFGVDLGSEPDGAMDPTVQSRLSEDLGLIVRAARGGLTILAGPDEDALSRGEARGRVAALCGLQQGDLSFGEGLVRGLHGARLHLAGDEVFVVSSRGLDPLGGLHLPDLVRWSGLRSFVRAYARQMRSTVTPPSAETPHHYVAHTMALAALKLAPGKEEPLLSELEGLKEGQQPEGGLVGELLQMTRDILHHTMLDRVRLRAGDAAAAVVIGAARIGSFEHNRPVLVCTGSASAEHPSWVELRLRGSEGPVLRGSGHQGRPAAVEAIPPLRVRMPAEASAPIDVSAAAEVSVPAEVSAPAENSAAAETSVPAEVSAPAENSAPVETSVPAEASAPVESSAPAEAGAPAHVPTRDSVAPQAPRGGRDQRRHKQQQQPQRAGGEPQQPPAPGEPPKGSSE